MHLTDLKQCPLHRLDAAGAAVLVFVSVTGYLTIVGPLLQQQSVTATLRCETQTQREKAAELRAAIGKVKERLGAVQQETATNAIRLDTTSRINRRIAGLTQSFSECALEVDDVRTGRICSSPRYDVVPITVTGRGPYRECVRFFHGLCSAFPDLSVMQIELAGNPARPGDPEQFRLELFWYAASSNPVQTSSSEGSSRDMTPPS